MFFAATAAVPSAAPAQIGTRPAGCAALIRRQQPASIHAFCQFIARAVCGGNSHLQPRPSCPNLKIHSSRRTRSQEAGNSSREALREDQGRSQMQRRSLLPSRSSDPKRSRKGRRGRVRNAGMRGNSDRSGSRNRGRNRSLRRNIHPKSPHGKTRSRSPASSRTQSRSFSSSSSGTRAGAFTAGWISRRTLTAL